MSVSQGRSGGVCVFRLKSQATLEMAQETAGWFIGICDDERIYSRIMDIDDVIIGKIGTCDCKDEQIEAAPVS